jgi:RND family efflux transporter MFP subunit
VPSLAADANDGAIRAVTAPSKDRALSLDVQGRIAKVLVDEGQAVRARQPLVQLDDALEQAQLKTLKVAAYSDASVRAAEARRTHTVTVLARVTKAYQDKAAPEAELEEARFAAGMADLQLEVERLQKQQDRAKYDEALVRVERMKLCSPIDGIVERVLIHEGQIAEAAKGVVRVVAIDPLTVDAPVPLATARRLAVGGKAEVRLIETPGARAADAGAKRTEPTRSAEGRIVRISAVADAASETLEVRIELPNPSARPAGEHVTVAFPVQQAAK